MPFGLVPKGFIFSLLVLRIIAGKGEILLQITMAVVGAGRVGSALAVLLSRAGCKIVGVSSRTLESAVKLAQQVGAPAATVAAAISAAELVLITTPDRCIESVVNQAAANGAFKPGQIVLHTCGSQSANVLRAAKHSGAFTGCMHPLQTFADTEIAIANLPGSFFALSGDAPAIAIAQQIVTELKGQSCIIADEQRPLYHAAACVASNYAVALIHCATQICARIGLTEGQAIKSLLPLIAGTLRNVQAVGTIKALTGPISRGDGITVANHLAAMKDADAASVRLYTALGKYTLNIAEQARTLDSKQVAELKKILSAEGQG